MKIVPEHKAELKRLLESQLQDLGVRLDELLKQRETIGQDKIRVMWDLLWSVPPADLEKFTNETRLFNLMSAKEVEEVFEDISLELFWEFEIMDPSAQALPDPHELEQIPRNAMA